MIDYYEIKSQPITRVMVLQAYKKVRANKGSGGVDNMSWEWLDNNLNSELYKLWNRLTSGSYFPMPVKEVPIKKKGGGERKLGIPTLLDRIAQQVAKTHLERIVEPLFHNSSFGYRPSRNCHQAVAQACYNTFNHVFVIDLDIKGFFDNIDHELMMKAVRFYCQDKWVLLYVERWLKAGIVQQDGNHVDRLTGTPQGGVITPLTHLLTLNFLGELLLSGENFNFGNFINSSIFVMNGKITELGISKADQSCLYFIKRRQTSARGSKIFNERVWSVSDSGVSLCSAGQRPLQKDANTGKFSGVYCEITSQPNQTGKGFGRNSRPNHQQRDKASAGGISSEAGKWQKRSNNLSYPLSMTGRGSKNSHSCTIFLFQRTKLILAQKNSLKLN
jgi:retron-type reverse transcriptase